MQMEKVLITKKVQKFGENGNRGRVEKRGSVLAPLSISSASFCECYSLLKPPCQRMRLCATSYAAAALGTHASSCLSLCKILPLYFNPCLQKNLSPSVL